MKFTSGHMTQASGSVGGLTYSRNRYGMYVRAKATPVNPNTGRQATVRANLALLAVRWKQTLTAGQRAAWKTYADNTPVIDNLGHSQILTGLNWYVACNSLRLQAGLTVVDDGPVIFGQADLTPTGCAITAADDTVALEFTNSDQWATEVGGAILLFGSAGKSPSIDFFGGPYQYAGKVEGAVVPPVSPQDIVLTHDISEGQQVFLKAVAVLADGRISAPYTFREVAVA